MDRHGEKLAKEIALRAVADSAHKLVSDLSKLFDIEHLVTKSVVTIKEMADYFKEELEKIL